jgi:hypothetical protein
MPSSTSSARLDAGAEDRATDEDGARADATSTLADWMASRPDSVARLRQIIGELRGAAALDWAMVGVALREARALVEAA